MKAFTQIAFLASASVVTANTMTFQSLDDIDRTVYCTPTVGYSTMEPVTVPAGEDVSVKFDHGWIGNCYAVHDGAKNVPGMLAEVAWDQWGGLNFFDVSAIVDPTDVDNVHEMYPKKSGDPVSGCEVFPCDNCYYLPDDIQTKSTKENEIICTLSKNGYTGTSNNTDTNSHSHSNNHSHSSHSNTREEHPVFGRNYVMGKF